MASVSVKSANFTYKTISISFDNIFIDNKIVRVLPTIRLKLNSK